MAYAVTASVVIDAPRETVWRVLTDLDSYHLWNPFTPKVESTLEVDAPIWLHVQMTPKKRIRQKEWVRVVEPESELAWGMTMGHPVLLRAHRSQTLTPLDARTTRYETVDEMHGILVPLVKMIYGRHLERGFDRMVRGLKTRAEALG